MRYILITLIFMLLINSCNKNPASSSGNMGTLKISLMDAPADYQQVLITFSEVSANINDQWKIISSQSQTVDLLTLTNGRTILLGENQLEAGTYSQIRLKISDAKVVVNGVNYSLKVPSGSESGLKFGHSFQVTAGITYSLIVDFDANRSIHSTGNGNYILQPVIRIVPEETSGAISGVVTNPQNSPVAYAIANGDTVTSTKVNVSSGNFLLGYLEAGTYTVSVQDTLNRIYLNPGVLVTVGKVTSLTDIKLQ